MRDKRIEKGLGKNVYINVSPQILIPSYASVSRAQPEDRKAKIGNERSERAFSAVPPPGDVAIRHVCWCVR